VDTILRGIDKLSEYSGKIFAWLIVPLVGALFYEVFARYLFRRPTEWAYDITYMFYGVLFVMAAAWALSTNRHVRIDVLQAKFSPRRRALIDALLYIVLFFPAITVLLVKGIEYAQFSWAMKEVSSAGAWRPPLYPLKTFFPIAMALLLLQGVAEFIRSLLRAIRKEAQS